jgi:hypothetical protein
MRRISRIDRPIGLLRIHSKARIPSTYQCLACKHRSTPLSTSSLRPAPSDEKAPFTEKIRQKLWGTDQPPGLDDPYGDGSFFDKTKKGPRQQKVEVRGQEPVQAPVEVEETTEGYKDNFPDDTRRATTWDGLNWVGGGPIWQPEEEFEGYLPADAATHPEVITAALHRALVEVFALQQAGKPLHGLSKQFPETDGVDDWTDNVQITPSSSGATIQMPEHSSLQEVMESLAAPEVNETIHEPQPTEAEEDVHADRSEVDPLKRKESHEPQPTESEEDVHADRSEVDPLKPGKSGERVSTAPIPAPAELIEADEEIVAVRTFEDVISSWDPSWLEISLENPDIKFAVSHAAIGY